MKYIKKVFIFCTVVLLAACGSDSGGGEANNAQTTENAESSPQPDQNTEQTPENSGNQSPDDTNQTPDDPNADVEQTPDDDSSSDTLVDLSGANGIYTYSNKPIALFVDLERQSYPIIGMDWEKKVFFYLYDAKLEGQTITATGLTGFADGSAEADLNKQTIIALGELEAQTSVNIANADYDYDFKQKTYSLSLPDLVGSHLAADGAEVVIYENDSIIINPGLESSSCTFSAKLEAQGVYYNMANLNATGCDTSNLNGSYTQGTLITIKGSDGNDYIQSLMIKGLGQASWVNAQISE